MVNLVNEGYINSNTLDINRFGKHISSLKANQVETIRNANGVDMYVKFSPARAGGIDIIHCRPCDSTSALWDVMTLNEFIDEHLKEHIFKPCGCIVSPDEIKRIKAVKYYNKKGYIYWFDNDGYFYSAKKMHMPTKKRINEYKLYGGNKDAVCVDIVVNNERQWLWFDNYRAAEMYYKSLTKESNNCFASPWMYVVTHGDQLKDPNKKPAIIRHPYCSIDMLKHKYPTNHYNKNERLLRMANNWRKIHIANNYDADIGLLQDILEKYYDYIEANK